MRHKHADLMIEFAETGRPVQYRFASIGDWKGVTGWEDIEHPSWIPELEYRFKPEVVRYKRYLYHQGVPIVVVLQKPLEIQYESDIEKSKGFIKWIDDEWQEVEI